MQHTICTQYAHTQTHIYAAHRTTHREQSRHREHLHNLNTEQHTCTHFIHIHSFDFIVEDYISKNSIIQLYTKLIHFGHLIYEVSK